MKRVIELPINIRTYDNQSVIKVSLTEDTIQILCLGLCLVEKHLIESIVLLDQSNSHKVSVSVTRENTHSQKGSVRWRTQGADIVLAPMDLSSVIRFCLQYYRDGIGAVDHIDIDLDSDPTMGNITGVYFTVVVPHAKPSITDEEVRRRLGLPKKRG